MFARPTAFARPSACARIAAPLAIAILAAQGAAGPATARAEVPAMASRRRASAPCGGGIDIRG